MPLRLRSGITLSVKGIACILTCDVATPSPNTGIPTGTYRGTPPANQIRQAPHDARGARHRLPAKPSPCQRPRRRRNPCYLLWVEICAMNPLEDSKTLPEIQRRAISLSFPTVMASMRLSEDRSSLSEDTDRAIQHFNPGSHGSHGSSKTVQTFVLKPMVEILPGQFHFSTPGAVFLLSTLTQLN